MTTMNQKLISMAYEAFNERNIDKILPLLHKDVHWPNGWEGGYVDGHDAVRAYWTRQWKEIDPKVIPVSFEEKETGQIAVSVRQNVKDLRGNLLLEGMIRHVYTIEDNLIKSMEIEKG